MNNEPMDFNTFVPCRYRTENCKCEKTNDKCFIDNAPCNCPLMQGGNNDLISREALKEALHNEIGDHALSIAVDRVIDNAPTVGERSYEQGAKMTNDTKQ